MSPSGGKRPGAGRPKGIIKPTALRSQVNVRLSAAELADAKRIGKGNAGQGLRIALEAYITERRNV